MENAVHLYFSKRAKKRFQMYLGNSVLEPTYFLILLDLINLTILLIFYGYQKFSTFVLRYKMQKNEQSFVFAQNINIPLDFPRISFGKYTTTLDFDFFFFRSLIHGCRFIPLNRLVTPLRILNCRIISF